MSRLLCSLPLASTIPRLVEDRRQLQSAAASIPRFSRSVFNLMVDLPPTAIPRYELTHKHILQVSKYEPGS
eukprot:6180199-Pleurochrysis_carterae.AAC.1